MIDQDSRPVVGVGVLIIKEGKALLGRRKNILGDGEFSCPGGHLEYGESLEAAARREMMEECSLEVGELKFLYVFNKIAYPPKHIVFIVFQADWISGEPQNLEPEKCHGWDWYPVDDLPQPLVYSMRFLKEALETGRACFDEQK